MHRGWWRRGAAEDPHREPLDRLAVRGVHRRGLEPTPDVRAPVVVELHIPVGQPPGATWVLPSVLAPTSLYHFSDSSGTGTVTLVSPARSLSVLDAAGLVNANGRPDRRRGCG